MAKRNNAINDRGASIPLYLVMNDIFKVKKSNNLFKINTNYQVVGWGYAKKNDSGVRKEFWELRNLHNDKSKSIIIWKRDLEKIWDNELIIMVK
jgi:hypothetical protein